MATFNSPSVQAKALMAILFLFTNTFVLAADDQAKIFAARAKTEFYRAQNAFKSNTNDFTAAWQFGRACFDYADCATDNDQRADIAKQGIAACRVAITREPKSAAGHYYLGMDLGQLAQTELVGALKLVKEMEREFKLAMDADAGFDYAGPERNLGLLYRDAPGWPASIGSKRKSRDYLERAVKLSLDDPENILNLLESYLKWGEIKNARTEMGILEAHWQQAQKTFVGEAWEKSWSDWIKRRDAARQKLNETSTSQKVSK